MLVGNHLARDRLTIDNLDDDDNSSRSSVRHSTQPFLIMLEIPSDEVPSELKPVCEQILKRAKELRVADPVMSYWCE